MKRPAAWISHRPGLRSDELVDYGLPVVADVVDDGMNHLIVTTAEFLHRDTTDRKSNNLVKHFAEVVQGVVPTLVGRSPASSGVDHLLDRNSEWNRELLQTFDGLGALDSGHGVEQQVSEDMHHLPNFGQCVLETFPANRLLEPLEDFADSKEVGGFASVVRKTDLAEKNLGGNTSRHVGQPCRCCLCHDRPPLNERSWLIAYLSLQ